jgi:hypothetical protein
VTTFYKADIRKGWEAMQVACWVRDFQSDNDGWVFDAHNDIMAGQRERQAYEALWACKAVHELTAVANSFLDVWSDRLTEVGKEVIASWAN